MGARSMTRGGAGAAAVAAFLAVLFLGCGGAPAPPSGGSEGGPAASASPQFSLTDLAGNTVRLADSNGTVRFVGFWATWCAPCVEEIPVLNDLHAAHGKDGLTILMIAMDEEGAQVVGPFAEKRGLRYTVLLGNEDTPEAFGGISGMPTAFLLDRDGKVVDRLLGAVPRGVLEGKVKKALGIAG